MFRKVIFFLSVQNILFELISLKNTLWLSLCIGISISILHTNYTNTTHYVTHFSKSSAERGSYDICITGIRNEQQSKENLYAN